MGGTFLIFSMKDSKCEVASHGSILPRPTARRNIKSSIQELFPQTRQTRLQCPWRLLSSMFGSCAFIVLRMRVAHDRERATVF